MTGDSFPAPSRFTLVGRADANASEMMLSPGRNIQISADRRVDVRNYFGGLGKAAAGPQAYLTGVPAGGTVGAHFHDVSQFQIFFPNTGGWFGRQRINTYLVHYADAYTSYGPFGTNGEYLTFWTLRPRPATTTAFMSCGEF
jgi:hypothetical protein